MVVIGEAEIPVDDTPPPVEDIAEEAEEAEVEKLEEQADEASAPGFSSCRRPTLDDGDPAPAADPQPAPEVAPTVPAAPPLRADASVDRPVPPPAPEIHPIAEPSRAPAFAAPTLPGIDPRDEAERLTIFGARGQLSHRSKYRYPAVAASLVTVLAVVGWAALRPDPAGVPDGTEVASEQTTALAPTDTTEQETQQDTAALPGLSETDSAVLDALRVEPQPVEQLDFDPEQEEALYAATGISSDAPLTPGAPAIVPLDDLYVASIDRTDLSQDALALPQAQDYDTDQPVGQISLPGVAGAKYALDERGLVTPTPEGTLNPDGVMVYLGRPSAVPPPTPVRFETAPEADVAQERLAGQRPRLRPATLVDTERAAATGRALTPGTGRGSAQTAPGLDPGPEAGG